MTPFLPQAVRPIYLRATVSRVTATGKPEKALKLQRKADSYKYLTQQPAAARAGAASAVSGDVEQRARDGIIAVGTPDDLIKLFRTYREMGVDQMLTWVQFGGLEHGKIMKSMQLIGKHVIPELNR